MWDLDHFKMIVRGYANATNTGASGEVGRNGAALLCGSVATYLGVDVPAIDIYTVAGKRGMTVDEVAGAIWAHSRGVREWGTRDVKKGAATSRIRPGAETTLEVAAVAPPAASTVMFTLGAADGQPTLEIADTVRGVLLVLEAGQLRIGQARTLYDVVNNDGMGASTLATTAAYEDLAG